MDHSLAETHPICLMPRWVCERAAAQPDAERYRTYGYRPTPAKLTGQQLLIAQLTALGLANKEIAYLADISETTVKAHISAALRSLNLKRRTQLCRYIFEGGLLGEM